MSRKRYSKVKKSSKKKIKILSKKAKNIDHLTVSIAIPISIFKACSQPMFETYIVGQIASSASIFSIDEIVVYNDSVFQLPEDEEVSKEVKYYLEKMKFILEYLDCPQYLRKYLCKDSPFLRDVGICNPLTSKHHLKRGQISQYREGVVLENEDSSEDSSVSKAYVGLEESVPLDCVLEPGLRVTVQLNKDDTGVVVSPQDPVIKGGCYWGYTVRKAKCLKDVLKSERFESGYDLVVGTSEHGSMAQKATFPQFKHAMIVFGGPNGLEDVLKEVPPLEFFKFYVNVCQRQGVYSIRTEEAVPIALSALKLKLRPI